MRLLYQEEPLAQGYIHGRAQYVFTFRRDKSEDQTLPDSQPDRVQACLPVAAM